MKAFIYLLKSLEECLVAATSFFIYWVCTHLQLTEVKIFCGVDVNSDPTSAVSAAISVNSPLAAFA